MLGRLGRLFRHIREIFQLCLNLEAHHIIRCFRSNLPHGADDLRKRALLVAGIEPDLISHEATFHIRQLANRYRSEVHGLEGKPHRIDILAMLTQFGVQDVKIPEGIGRGFFVRRSSRYCGEVLLQLRAAFLVLRTQMGQQPSFGIKLPDILADIGIGFSRQQFADGKPCVLTDGIDTEIGCMTNLDNVFLGESHRAVVFSETF